MLNYYEYCEMIEETGVTGEILEKLIAEHMSTLGTKAYKLHGRYAQSRDAVPVFYNRTFEGEAQNKINNHIANDYFSEIVDTKAGYMFGQQVNITYNEDNEKVQDIIRNFGIDNNIDDLNSEVCTMAAVTGYDTMLIYLDKDSGKEKLIRIDPWEGIVISKTNITEPFAGVIYYKNWKEEYVVEYYDKQGKRVFKGDSDFTGLVEHTDLALVNPFKECQLVGVPNNDLLMGDAEKALSLIDGYDNAFSNAFDELDQFRLAYLLFIGYEPTSDMIKEMVKTGALYIPESGDGQDIKWLTKQLDPTFMKEVLDRTEANITRFASHVNFTDAAFGSDITGPAMRYKLFALETKSKKFERKHAAALRHIYKCLSNSLAFKGTSFDYLKLDFTYTRNIPVNLLDEAQTALALMGVASHETALKAISTVRNDVPAEMLRIEEEKKKYGDGGILDLDEIEDVEVLKID